MKFEIQVHIYKVSKAPKITDIMMDKLMYRLSIMKKMARINCCALTHYVGLNTHNMSLLNIFYFNWYV